ERGPDILREAVERGPPPHLARGLLNERFVAEFGARGEARILRRLAALDAIARRHVQVRANLLIEVLLAAAKPHISGLLGRNVHNARDGAGQLRPALMLR